MVLLVIFLVCMFAALGSGLMASVSDVRGLVIPNIYSVIVIAAFVVAWIILNVAGRGDVFASLTSHVLAALLMFALTASLFAARIMGAADLKLATAYAFWMGLAGLPAFLFYTTLAGGVLGVIAILLRRYKPLQSPREGGWIARSQAGESKVPYGVAIACGALASFVKLGYLGDETLGSFLLAH